MRACMHKRMRILARPCLQIQYVHIKAHLHTSMCKVRLLSSDEHINLLNNKSLLIPFLCPLSWERIFNISTKCQTDCFNFEMLPYKCVPGSPCRLKWSPETISVFGAYWKNASAWWVLNWFSTHLRSQNIRQIVYFTHKPHFCEISHKLFAFCPVSQIVSIGKKQK